MVQNMNIYIEHVISTALDNKYRIWYNNLILNALSRTIIDEYTERHHIVPVSFNRTWKREKDNIVKLTAREHFIAHLMLSKMYNDHRRRDMLYCLFLINSRCKDKKSSRRYAKIKEKLSKFMTENNPMKNLVSKNKVSQKLLGRNKRTHDYIRIANEKKSLYNKENSQWIRESRFKFKQTRKNMSPDEYKAKFCRPMSEENKRRQSIERIGKTKDDCERVRKMTITKRAQSALLSDDERVKKYSTTTGMNWFHNDVIRKSKLMYKENADNTWTLGRKMYENKKS